MKYFDVNSFIDVTKRAPYIPKSDFVITNVTNKDVLDLGFVQHSLDACIKLPDQWLHNVIRTHAKSVLGVDILEEEVAVLQKMGYDAIVADALNMRIDRKFDVIIAGDLIEHVADPGALLDTIAYHLRDDGVGLITTPNPFAANRYFNIFFDGWTAINTEHVSWFCPQTLFQLVERSELFIDDFCWIETHFPMLTKRRFWGRLANFFGKKLAHKNQLFRNDYGVILRKKQIHARNPDLQKPFVSVILPTYNRPDYLVNAIRSLMEQDYDAGRFEIIVVDNALMNNAAKLVYELAMEELGQYNIKHVREERPGLVFARHTGAALAEGDILLFGDDDAVFDRNWISAIVDVYMQNPKVGAVGTKISIQWDREPLPWVYRYENVLGKLDYGNRVILQQGLSIYGGSFSIRKHILRHVNGFNPGQMGEYIVGDSETGLCRKLAAEGIIVGWTPAATMWHVQLAEKHGTLNDIKRRFRNNGICDAYHATFYNWSFRQVLTDIMKKTYSLISRLVSAIRHLSWDHFYYDMSLQLAYYQYYFNYLWLYRFSQTIRKRITKKDWEFNHHYKAPQLQFYFRRGEVSPSKTSGFVSKRSSSQKNRGNETQRNIKM